MFSLDNIESSILAIHGGDISGRKIGDSLTNFAVSKMKDKGNDSPPYYLNYLDFSKDDAPLRSSSFFILDKSGTPRGVLTVNTDVSKYQRAAELLQQLAYLPNMENITPESLDVDRFHKTPRDMILEIIFEVTNSKDIEARRLSPVEKIEVVGRLNDENFFLMKGAVSQVASILEASDATIYRYLSKLNKKRE